MTAVQGARCGILIGISAGVCIEHWFPALRWGLLHIAFVNLLLGFLLEFLRRLAADRELVKEVDRKLRGE